MSTRNDSEWEKHPDLEELAMLLDQTDAEEQSVLDAALKLEDAPGLDSVQATLETEWARPRAGRGPNGWFRRLGLPLAAAAALIVALVIWPRPDDADPFSAPSGEWLATQQGPLRFTAAEEVATWSAVTWVAPPGASVELTVRTMDGEVLYGPEATMETHLSFGSDMTAKWPTQIFVELTTLDPSDQQRLSAFTQAWLPGGRTE